MSRYIDADEFKKIYDRNEKCHITINEALDLTPTADVRESVHGEWIIEEMDTYELSYGTTAYQPNYRCNCCNHITESYLRLDEPIMPEDADFPIYCQHCGARMDVGVGVAE